MLREAVSNDDYPVDETYQLFQIGYYFYSANQYDSAAHYYNLVLKSGSPRAADSASAMSGLGVVYSVVGRPHRSIPYYKQAISLYERLNDTTNAITNGYNLAIIYKDIGLYDDALEIAFRTLAKLEKQKPDRPLASSYNTIGTVYSRLQDYEKAYDYYRKALRVRLSMKHDQSIGQSFNNIGELFIEMGQYDSALSNLQLAASVRRRINDDRGLGRTLTLIGNTLVRSGKANEAKAALTEALSINRISNDNIGEVATLNGLGAAHIATREFKLAESNLDNALSLINKSGIKEHLKRNLELHVDLYRGVNDKLKLISTLEQIMIVKDSLLNVEKVESLVAVEVRYETEKKEQEIVGLQQQRKLDKAELDKNRIQIVALSIGLVMGLIIAMLSYRIYRQGQREKLKEKLSADLHMKEVHHRFKNHLQILSSIFTIQVAMLHDKRAKEVVKDIEGRVNAMGLLHKKLYKDDGPAEVELKEYVSELTRSLLFTYGFDSDRIKLDLSVADIKVNVDTAVRIGLILNELLTNALKYAYVDHNGPQLKAHIIKEAGSLQIQIADNGNKPFRPKGPDDNTSFGLQMVNSLVRELKGHIEVSTTKGTEYLINIPQ